MDIEYYVDQSVNISMIPYLLEAIHEFEESDEKIYSSRLALVNAYICFIVAYVRHMIHYAIMTSSGIWYIVPFVISKCTAVII